MKKFCIFFLLSIIISVTALGFLGVFSSQEQESTADFLRIHIRADSNTEEAQTIKYVVRDEVVNYLTPIVAECKSKQAAMQGIGAHVDDIARLATNTLNEHGLGYTASVRLDRETFPTRVYNGYTLPQGEYTALIIELGTGKGDNWWCVVYPPLCFASPTGKNVVYKSKIAEIIAKWKEKRA